MRCLGAQTRMRSDCSSSTRTVCSDRAGCAFWRVGWTRSRRGRWRVAADKRKQALEEAQNELTAASLDRWVGRNLEVLIEEPIQGSAMALGRSFLQAQEVDGLVVVHGEGLTPGQVVQTQVTKRNGVDLEASVLV